MAVEESLQYPVEDTSDYGGRIVFRVLKEREVNLSALVKKASKTDTSAVKDVLQGVTEGASNLLGGQSENSIDAKQIQETLTAMKGLTQQAIKPKDPEQYTREVSLYLPVGLQFRDNVGYENADLLSSTAGAAAAIVGQSTAKDLETAGASQAASLALVRVAQQVGQGAGLIARQVGRVTTNPNTRALFKSVALREFAFTFKFLPCSKREADEVKKIIQLFREELYPRSIEDAGASLGYQFPNRFKIQIEYNQEQVTSKILPCFLRDVSVTYNPSTMAMHDDGNFSEIDMSLSFTESRTLDRQQIEAGF